MLFVFWTQTAIIGASCGHRGGEFPRLGPRFIKFADLLVERCITEVKGFKFTMVWTVLPHEYTIVTEEDLTFDHLSTDWA
jgi:hypothetical protein